MVLTTAVVKSGVPGRGDVIPPLTALIAEADAEVAVIRTTQPIKATNLNALYDQMGAQLSYEQRARFTGIGPVPTGTRDRFLNAYPSSLMVFVDSLQELSKNTLPHMQVQTLEAISNLDLTGGQSIIGAMRESRNTARLDAIGVAQDNVIDGTIQEAQEIELLLNGTLLTSIPPTDVPSPIVDPYVFNSSVPIKFTPPALVEPAPEPLGYFDGTNIIATTEVTPGNPSILLPSNQPVLAQQLASLATNPNAPFPTNQISQANQVYPTVGTLVPAGQGKVLDVGKAPPGSLAPSKAINLLPPNLKVAAGTVLSSTFSVPEAIDEVIKCNCDCWVQ